MSSLSEQERDHHAAMALRQRLIRRGHGSVLNVAEGTAVIRSVEPPQMSHFDSAISKCGMTSKCRNGAVCRTSDQTLLQGDRLAETATRDVSQRASSSGQVLVITQASCP